MSVVLVSKSAVKSYEKLVNQNYATLFLYCMPFRTPLFSLKNILFLSYSFKCMILISFIADDHAEASVNLNKDTFSEDVEKTPHLVMFYAPWYVFNLSESDTFLFQESQSSV